MLIDTTPSRETLIEALQSFAEEVDGVPTIREMRQEGEYSPYHYKKKFGNWHDALRAADIQPVHGVTLDVDREELVAELKRVDEQIERPPRRTDVEEYGEYSYQLYVEEFESFIHALEEAGIEPEEKQYRFSSVDTPEELKGSANIEKLRNHGPLPTDELPQDISPADRGHGVWKFSMPSGATNPADDIYYLNDEHALGLVIRRFFEYNPHVLEYRDPHGIKIDISDNQPSWKEIGRDIVDELIGEGAVTEFSFENLVVVHLSERETLQYCFDSSIRESVDVDELPVELKDCSGHHPVWGFPNDKEEIWRRVSKRDGLLFSTRPGVYTHYVPISETVENRNVMTELWVEYEDGVRNGGIEQPWPYLVVGEETWSIRIEETELAEVLDTTLPEEPVALLDSETVEPLLNSYGGFEAYLRERGRSEEPPATDVNIEELSSTQDVIEFLLHLPERELPIHAEESELEQIEREKREAAFREGIYESYPGCAICGKRFEAPNGSVDLEAAHILPKSEDGPDVVQNGLALCSHHHWAFDNGWFEWGVDYTITLRHHPELQGYESFETYDGESLQLPDDPSLRPHPMYIRQRNELAPDGRPVTGQ